MQIICPDGAPCYDITVENFYMWTESGSEVLYKCESGYGSGGCLKGGTSYTSYPVTTSTVLSVPAA